MMAKSFNKCGIIIVKKKQSRFKGGDLFQTMNVLLPVKVVRAFFVVYFLQIVAISNPKASINDNA